MDRKKRIYNRILSVLLITIAGCVQDESPEGKARLTLSFSCNIPTSRAILPDEDAINDINLLIFDSKGELENHIFMKNGNADCSLSLLKGMSYSLYACANLGYRIQVSDLDSLLQMEFHLAYPDEYRNGIPMTGSLKQVTIHDNTEACMELSRMMARICLRMDRSRLSKDIHLNVIGARIGNCPKKAKAFTSSRAETPDDCFQVGFSHDESGCHPLNKTDAGNLSDIMVMYMFENMQGNFSEAGKVRNEDKVFKENDPRKDICSYIEMELEYSSKDWITKENPLIYRFYLGDEPNSLDIERNCSYRITVCPEDDGLHGDGWRVDKSGLEYTGVTSFNQYPGDYIVGDIGDVVHIGCSLTPAHTPFDVGEEYMKADKAEGIYDYRIDPDGHGATLTLTGPGRGLIYMEAGDPIDDAALFVIEVNRQEQT